MPSKIKIDKRKLKHRLPTEIVDVLKHKGGPHSTKKGKRGYDRKHAKKELWDRFNDRDQAPFFYSHIVAHVRNLRSVAEI
ncbi:MAG: hypothetical protein WCL23_00915 [Candidatus Moraniibacteriota bacterium]